MEILNKISGLLKEVKDKQPLVHHITNYVTVNDCANIVLALGGSPIMADEIEEIDDMVSIINSLVINIGTLNQRTVESMIAAGKRANNLGIPVVFDPVGAGATRYRTQAAQRIISEVKLAVIRGNISEIKTISGLKAATRGVDASSQDMEGSKDGISAKDIASGLARKLKCVVAITGPVDTVSDGEKVFSIHNGHSMLSRITGTGCMCSSLIGAFCGVADDFISATAAGVIAMGLAGERAYKGFEGDFPGTESFRVKLMDSVFSLSPRIIQQEGKIHEL